LNGNWKELNWKYFKPADNPYPELDKTPLVDKNNEPSYCTDSIDWIEDKWTLPEDQKNLFKVISSRYYDALYDTMVKGSPLIIDPADIRQQIGVIEECQRQNPHIYSS